MLFGRHIFYTKPAQDRRKYIANRLEEQGIYDVDFIEPNFEGSFLNIDVPDRVLGIIDY